MGFVEIDGKGIMAISNEDEMDVVIYSFMHKEKPMEDK